MMAFEASMITAAASSVPGCGVRLAYGTAGFRADAKLLDSIFLRMGMLAALRSASHGGQVVGVMVTASHNGIEDNGVKMVDADGGMLAQAWEQHACALADAAPCDVADTLTRIAASEGIVLPPSRPFAVLLGRDTRPSSPALAALAARGAGVCGAAVEDVGVVTTPQLHHCVRFVNMPLSSSARASCGGLDGYFRMLREGFDGVLAGISPRCLERGPLVLDCANGVGGAAAARLADAFAGCVVFELRNTGNSPCDAAMLNDSCGAEHVQKGRLPPRGFGSNDLPPGSRCASLDGDADRVVYHSFRPASSGIAGIEPEWRLFDGDKIAALAASFVGELLLDAGLTVTDVPSHEGSHAHGAVVDAGASPASRDISNALAALLQAPVSVGIVQTAYANGASTSYMVNELRLPVRMAKTGVKFVHAAAAAFDIGIYFEANGHGTVVFHPTFTSALNAACDSAPSGENSVSAPVIRALRRLRALSLLVNQAVGDALSDLLLVEAVLAVRGWSLHNWDAIYEDLPSRQAKLAVRDRAAITTTPNETRVLEPKALQDAIDALVSALPNGRAFVRPSGTEDVVRIYAEALTQADADSLAAAVARVVHDLAGGVGTPPPLK